MVEKGKLIAKWDPFNAVIITEATGKIEFEGVIENVTYKIESDETTGLREIIIESKDKTKVPTAHILTEDGDLIRTYNLPVGINVMIENGQKVKAGEVIVKIPRAVGKAGDITGGLPRVTELFEARNPSNPAVVSEIDGEVTMGKIKRGNREIIVTSKTGEVKKYLLHCLSRFWYRKMTMYVLVLRCLTVLLLRQISWQSRVLRLYRNIS